MEISGPATPVLAPSSVDRVKLIRRSMRCWVYGAIGLIPVIGIGLAVLALRMRDELRLELGDGRKAPAVYFYWLTGLILIWLVDSHYGLAGAAAIAVLLLALQSFHVARRLTAIGTNGAGTWNPAHPQVVQGVLFAYAGMALSLWLLGILGRRALELTAAP